MTSNAVRTKGEARPTLIRDADTLLRNLSGSRYSRTISEMFSSLYRPILQISKFSRAASFLQIGKSSSIRLATSRFQTARTMSSLLKKNFKIGLIQLAAGILCTCVITRSVTNIQFRQAVIKRRILLMLETRFWRQPKLVLMSLYCQNVSTLHTVANTFQTMLKQ